MHIPTNIAPIETLVRGIFRPLFYSGNKLKPNAFMPGPDKADVSVLRLCYTNADFCKRHTSSIPINNNTYCGLATIDVKSVEEANSVVFESELTVSVSATPLREDKTIREASEEISSDDEGLPMHADLIYSQPNRRGETNPDMQNIARFLLHRSSYYADPDIESDTWLGPALPANPLGEAA